MYNEIDVISKATDPRVINAAYSLENMRDLGDETSEIKVYVGYSINDVLSYANFNKAPDNFKALNFDTSFDDPFGVEYLDITNNTLKINFYPYMIIKKF